MKRILVNLILIIFALASVEFYSFCKTKQENIVLKEKADRLESNNTKDYKTKYILLKPFSVKLFRKSYIKENSTKKPILWFGCSFAEGAGLTDKQAPCFKISELTSRSCINRAKGATGPQFMYYQLKQGINVDTDLIIYIFMYNHLQRLYNYQINPLIDMFNLRYTIKDFELVDVTPTFNPLYSSFFVKRILNKKVALEAKTEGYEFKLFNRIMKKSYDLAQEKYPNSKFIMIEFPELTKKELPEYEIRRLESMGIIVVKVKDLIPDVDVYNKKYWLSDKIHPSEELWDLVLPKLNKEYLQ
jgi:hypothetical protein